MVAFISPRQAAAVVGAGEIRIESDGLVKVPNRMIKVLLAEMNPASPEIGACQARINSDRFIEVGQRFVLFFQFSINVTPGAVKACISRSLRQSRREMVESMRQIDDMPALDGP